MKDFLHSIFKTTEERIKNPFIGAFMTSWFLFNWKPILFLIFSSQIIEDKIKYIEISFSNICFVLWYPLISAVFYILVLPYLNLFIDELLKYSLLKRNVILINKQKQTIENQKHLAIEEIKLEEAKTDFRERNTHNKLVEELQKNIKELEIKSEMEKNRSSEMLDQLKMELNNRDKITNNEIRNFEKRYSESRSEIMNLNEKLFDKDKQIQSLQSRLNEENLKYNNNTSNVIVLPNGLRLVERFENDKKYYYSPDLKERYTENDIKRLMDNKNTSPNNR